MTIKHIRGDDIYVIHSDRAKDRGEPWWRGSRVGYYDDAHKVEASVEWTLLGRHNFGIGFQLGHNGGESDIGLNIYLGRLASIWMRLRSPWTKWANIDKDAKPSWYEARHTGIRFFPYDGCWVRLEVENYDGSGPRNTRPWWREWRFGSHEFWGGTDCVTEKGATGEVAIPLPEGNYTGLWTEEVRTWRHRRFPGTLRDRIMGARTRKSVDIKIEGGIPIEGKGENSWDCGMDGLFGTGGATVEDAVANCVRSVLRMRKDYGGPHNLPHPMTLAEAEAWQAAT